MTGTAVNPTSGTSAVSGAGYGTRRGSARRCDTDEASADAGKHYDEQELAALMSLIALITRPWL